MNHEQEINENVLDELLRDLYLEDNSHALNEREADFVLTQDYDVMIDPLKEQALLKRLSRKSGKLSPLGWYLLVLALITILVLLLLCLMPRSGPAAASDTGTVSAHLDTAKMDPQNNLAGRATTNTTPAGRQVIHIRLPDTFGRLQSIDPVSHRDSVIKAGRDIRDQSAIMPYLADKDRILYRKIKEQMILQLLQSNKDLYTHVPANKLNYAGKPLIYDAFTIRNVQITNLEYRAFLADLLAQKKEEDYLAANVLTGYWASEHYPELAALYFQSEAYNDFPVVAITMQGAGLFCRWFEEETALYIKQRHLKMKPLKIRLPYDEDWIAAAREGYAKIAFEKGYNTMYDETEKLVDEAFARRVEVVKKRTMRVDSLYAVFTTNRYGWNEKELLAFFAKGMNVYPGVPADTIYTSRMKVQGKIGRVSEIVLQKGSSKVWLAGLSWKSKQDYLKMENGFRINTASPYVGFRIVVINPDDPEYKSPFW